MAASRASAAKTAIPQAVTSKSGASKAITSKVGAAKNSASHAAGEVSRPADALRESLTGLSGALAQRASHAVTQRIESTTKNLAQRAADAPGLPAGAKDLAEGKPLKAVAETGVSRLKEKVKDAVSGLGGGKRGSKGGKLKITNIVESVDVGVPVKVAYDQWTRFSEFPSFMKKVEHVEQRSPERVTWKAQILWSHRQWESTITEQVPDERIVWTSKGEKGRVDGSVTFHELAPSLTRIVVVLVYSPQGLFEHVGNMFRAQGRRARLELKHFQRHVMTQTILHADELEGWRGEIHDGKVTEDQDENQDTDTDEDADRDGGGRNGKASGNGKAGRDSREKSGAAARSKAASSSSKSGSSGRTGSAKSASSGAGSGKSASSRTAASKSAASKSASSRTSSSRTAAKTSERSRPARARAARSSGKAGAS